MYPLRFHPSYGYAAYCGTSFLSSTGNRNPVEHKKGIFYSEVVTDGCEADRPAEKRKYWRIMFRRTTIAPRRKINGVSATTVKNIVLANAEIVGKCEQKKEENTADVLAYMDAHKDLVCSFIGKGLELLNDPDKLKAANLSQITTAMGTLIDKWAMIGGNPTDTIKEDALSVSLREMAEGLESDD